MRAQTERGTAVDYTRLDAFWLGWQVVARIGADVCGALETCHELGIVHRDVKPANVFRTGFGEYKLGDFGIAKQVGPSASSAHTQLGTMRYVAPEIVRGESYDERVDVYSLGVMLYELLNGMRPPLLSASSPVRRCDLEEAGARRLRGEPLPPPRFADERLASIVLRACEADRSRRYPTARSLGDDLRAWLGSREGREGPVRGRHMRRPTPAEQPPPDEDPDATARKIPVDTNRVVPPRLSGESDTRGRDEEDLARRRGNEGEATDAGMRVDGRRGGRGIGMRVTAVLVLSALAIGIVVVCKALAVPRNGEGSDAGANAKLTQVEGLTLEAVLADEELERDDNPVLHDDSLREKFSSDYPDVSVSTNVEGNTVNTLISLGRELTPLEAYSFQVWLRDSDMESDIAQSISKLEDELGIEGILHGYTVLDSSSTVIAQATFAASGVVQFEGLNLSITLEDAMGDPSIAGEIEESIEKTYESVEPGWQVWVTAQGNELKILLRSDRDMEDLDISAAVANAKSEAQAESMSKIAASLEKIFHIEGVTVRLTMCDRQDNALVSTVYSVNGLVS